MKRSGFAISAASIWFFMSSTAGFCADLVGMVADAQYKPIQGVVITVQVPGGTAPTQAVTNARGAYRITGLSPGLYDLALKSQLASCQGGTSMAYVGKQGLSVDWLCSPKTEAIALAKDGASAIQTAGATNGAGAAGSDPFGTSWPTFYAFVIGGSLSLALGIVTTVNNYITSHIKPPASPSL